MKTLEQIQKENRKAIILANNPEAGSYEQAMKSIIENKGWSYEEELKYCNIEVTIKLYYELTLDRVLISLDADINIDAAGNISRLDNDGNFGLEFSFICKWDLTKPTLEKQSEQTQREINKLLTK